MNGNTFFSAGYNRVLATVALVALIIALAAYAQYTIKQTEYAYTGPTTISVLGTAEVLAIPDIGQFSFSVIAEGADAKTAQASANEKTNAILAYLKEAQVAENDIKTEQYNLYPRYRYEQQPCFAQFCPPGEQIQDGFEVNQTVRVKVRNLDQAGELLAGVGERGATNISGLEFTVDDTETVKAQARTEAIADAKAKAEVLAKELGVRLVKMTGYYEDEGGGYPIPYYGGMGGDMMERSAVASAPEIPVGENTIRSRVTLTYQIK